MQHDYRGALADLDALENATNALIAKHAIDGARGMRIIAAAEVTGRALLALLPSPPTSTAPPPTPAPTPPHGHGHHGDNSNGQGD
jgi:hypothetical protein